MSNNIVTVKDIALPVTLRSHQPDYELDTIRECVERLERMSPEQRQRAMKYLVTRFEPLLSGEPKPNIA